MENSLTLITSLNYEKDFIINYNKKKSYNIQIKTESNWLNIQIIDLKNIPKKFYFNTISFPDLNNFFYKIFNNNSLITNLDYLVQMIIEKKLILIEKENKIILCYDYDLNGNLLEFNLFERNKDNIIEELIEKIKQLELENLKLKKKIIKNNKRKIINYKERRKRKKRRKINNILCNNNNNNEINKIIKENINIKNFNSTDIEINSFQNKNNNIENSNNNNISNNISNQNDININNNQNQNYININNNQNNNVDDIEKNINKMETTNTNKETFNFINITTISYESIINCIIQLKDSRICIGLVDCIINIYNKNTFSLSLTINAVQ